jgi:hypothetical protein
MTKALDQKPKYFRTPVARGLQQKDDVAPVDRKGGQNGAGIIRRFAVITRGEALGHDAWIDATALAQVRDAINAAKADGIKARFTHPALSADGLGSFLGRAMGPAEIDGDRVVADLHFSESAHKTPDGDLASYVMDLAEEDPDQFGASIVFAHDRKSESEFENEHTEEITDVIDGKERKRQRFKSPDPENVQNFYHIRIRELRAVDAVDEPAANPTGLFTRGQEVAREADELLSYACGLTTDVPVVGAFNIHPDRLAGFVGRFLEEHGLTLTKKDSAMAETNAATNAASETAAANSQDQTAASAAPATNATAPADPDAALKAERARISNLTALCELAKVTPATRQKWIEEGLSVEDVMPQVRQQLAANNPPPDPGQGEQHSDPNAKFKAEFAKRDKQAREQFPELTEEDYVYSRRVDEGLEPLRPAKKA